MEKKGLCRLTAFLRETERILVGSGLRLDFSKGYDGSFIKDVFAENSFIGMLEATDLESIDQLSFFLGAITDIISKTWCSSEVRQLLTSSFDFLSIMRRENIFQTWTTAKLSSSQLKIIAFIAIEKRIFEVYRASRMRTQKWRLDVHLVDATRHVGKIDFPHAEICRASQKIVKAVYVKNS